LFSSTYFLFKQDFYLFSGVYLKLVIIESSLPFEKQKDNSLSIKRITAAISGSIL
jgi:hypothetical protein